MIPFCLMAPRHATFHNLLRPYTVCCGVHCLRTGRELGNICPSTECACSFVLDILEVLRLIIRIFGIYLLFRIRYIRSVGTLLIILNLEYVCSFVSGILETFKLLLMILKEAFDSCDFLRAID